MLVTEFPELDATPNWHKRAECRGMDPDLFYPDKGGIDTFTQAQRVCDSCPVALQCLQFAIKHGEHFGVWGGTNSKGRRPRTAARSIAALRKRQGALIDERIVEVPMTRLVRKRS